MTLQQAIEILQAAAHEAELHRRMAVHSGDRDKTNKFREIRDGYHDGVDLLQAHQRTRLVTFDKRLMNMSR